MRLHKERRAEHERFVEGYKRYCEGHERERRQAQSEAFDRHYRQLLGEQRRMFREKPRTTGGEFLSLDPRGHHRASELAAEDAANWVRAHPLLSDVEWSRKHEREWKT